MKLRLIACALVGAGFAAAAGAKTPVNADLLQAKSEAKAARAELPAAVTTTGLAKRLGGHDVVVIDIDDPAVDTQPSTALPAPSDVLPKSARQRS